MKFLRFLLHSARLVLRGGRVYGLWMAFLVTLIAWGAAGYVRQLREGLIVTALRDPLSWGFYIGNFTFLVGVAAAAVMLVIPAYLYHWKPLREVAILGELLAISALVMCMLFVTVDVGRPERLWRLVPFAGSLNLPSSLLAWDVLVMTLYLLVNVVVVGHLLYASFMRRTRHRPWVTALILLSIPLAVAIHTVTAFVYNGLPARPFWNAGILAPRFLASAFCSGPAILLIVFQLLQRWTRFEIREEAIWKIAELMAYAMFINLFLLGAEIFKEFYSGTHHLVHTRYLYAGIGSHTALVPYAWASLACSLAAFVLFLIPATRKNLTTLNLGCLLIYAGVYLEKGMGLVIPGFTPSTLGEIYEYVPTITELQVGAGIFGVGLLVFTALCRVAIPIGLGEFSIDTVSAPALTDGRGGDTACTAPAPDGCSGSPPAPPARCGTPRSPRA